MWRTDGRTGRIFGRTEVAGKILEHRIINNGVTWKTYDVRRREKERRSGSAVRAEDLLRQFRIRLDVRGRHELIRDGLWAVKERTVITKSSDFARRQRNFRTTHDGSDGYKILPLSQTWPVEGWFSVNPSTLLSEPYCPQRLKAKRLLYVPATLILTIRAFLAQYMHEFSNIFTTNSDNFPT